jgi:hypothetical protein
LIRFVTQKRVREVLAGTVRVVEIAPLPVECLARFVAPLSQKSSGCAMLAGVANKVEHTLHLEKPVLAAQRRQDHPPSREEQAGGKRQGVLDMPPVKQARCLSGEKILPPAY